MRTYSIELGLDQVPEIAQRHGLKVMQGLWLSSQPDENRVQIDTTVALAKQYPDVIRAVVVGNEVLLRGEMSAADLADTIREVKAQVPMPVTYADVWEFWLRNRDARRTRSISSPSISCRTGRTSRSRRGRPPPMSTSIRQQVAAAFPGKEILIGEVGWPSAGRMREGALPSPANQARVLQEMVALAQAREFPRQRDRGLRPAVEAPARRHGRRPLGLVRRRDAAAEIRAGGAGLQSSGLALAGRRRALRWRR